MSKVLIRLSSALQSDPIQLGLFRDLLQDLVAAATQQSNGTEPNWDDLELKHSNLLQTRESATEEIDSRHLLHGRRTIVINHHGERYRLMETRNGKLILQK